MTTNKDNPTQNKSGRYYTKPWFIAGGLFLFVVLFSLSALRFSNGFSVKDPTSTSTTSTPTSTPVYIRPQLNISTYEAKIIQLANIPEKILKEMNSTSTPTSSPIKYPWPVKTSYPLGGAILPFDRIVAYYGNFYSKEMGILGQYPEPQVLAMLASTTAEWAAADTSTPVIAGIDYIAVAAQNNPGPNGTYTLRMPASQIDQAISMADQLKGITILDVQVGQSTVEAEVPLLKQYLEQPNVELALDPEFDMHNGAIPGTVIGSMSATDINFAIQYLANLVQEYNLPPKVLVVHMFTDDMVTNYQDIKPVPEVQVAMDMDGFGTPDRKIKIYDITVSAEPVEFTGIKLFYKNDTEQPGSYMLTPQQILKLSPQPSFIQYQ